MREFADHCLGLAIGGALFLSVDSVIGGIFFSVGLIARSSFSTIRFKYGWDLFLGRFNCEELFYQSYSLAIFQRFL